MKKKKIALFLSYGLTFLEAASSLILVPFLLKTIGDNEYGVYKLVIAINSYLLLLDLGVGNSVIKFIAKYRVSGDKEKEMRFIGISNFFYFLVSLLALVVGVCLIFLFPHLFSKGLTQEEIALGQKLLLIIVVNTFVTLITTTYSNILIAYEKFILSRTILTVQIVLKFALTLLVLKFGFGSIGAVLIVLILTILVRLFMVFYAKFKLGIKPVYRNSSKNEIIEIISFSFFILLSMVATQINSSVDQILIGSIVSNSSGLLAKYAIGTQLSYYFQQIAGVYTVLFFPIIVRKNEIANKSDVTHVFKVETTLIFGTLFPIFLGFVLCGKDFINFWCGSGYDESYLVAIILMFGNLLSLTFIGGSQILWAKALHKEQSLLKLLIVFLNLIISVFLILWNPLIGSALGTLISLFVGDFVLGIILYKKKFNFKFLKFVKDTCLFSFICGVLSFIVAFGVKKLIVFENNFLNFLIPLLTIVIIYFPLIYFFKLKNLTKSNKKE